jgi:hypothetical protein
MTDFTDITITAILTAAIKEIVSLISLAIKKYLINREWGFKFTFLKRRRSLDDNTSSVNHPNTPFTFNGQEFVAHL